MIGLVIFLSILLAIFAIVAVVLIVMIVSVSRKISRIQRNSTSIQRRISEMINFATMASSAAATAGAVWAKINVLRQKQEKNKRATNDQKTNDK